MSKSALALSAPALAARGYSPLPIAPAGDDDWAPKGKEPGVLDVRGGEPVWRRLKKWDVFCERQAHPKIIAHWAAWPDAGVGLACGFGGLVAVDIDDDALIDPIRAVLPPIMVAKRGRKGFTAFYRAAEPLPSKNYRTEDKRGLLDFLGAGKQTVLPPTAHPSGGRYEWITEQTLLDTSITQLPEITGAHVAAIEAVLRSHGWEAPARPVSLGEPLERPARSAAPVAWGDDNVNAAALANLSAWVPDLDLPKLRRHGAGYRAVAPWRGSGTGRGIASRSANLGIHPTGIRDFGSDDTFSAVTLVAEASNLDYSAAAAWLRHRLGLPQEPVLHLGAHLKPTYRDNRVSLAEASARLRTLTGDEFSEAIQTGIGVRNQGKLKPPLIQPSPPVSVVRVEAGVGKTHTAIEALAKQARLGRRFVYVVPRHDLAGQVATSFAARGVKAEVYRGYQRPDPLAPDHLMCRNIPAYEATRTLGIGAREAVCQRRIDNEVVRCPLASVCGMERQREARTSVWVIPAALLFTKRQDFLFEPDAVVIDEGFIDNAIGDSVAIDVTTLLKAKIEACNDEERDAVERFRHRLVSAIKMNGDGPLSRAALINHGIDAEDAYAVGWLEQRRVSSSILRPDMRESELKTAAYRHGARNKLARAAGMLWHEIATFLEEWKIESILGDRSQSGRITVADGKVSVTPLQPVHPSWRAPTLVLDATAPPASLLAIALGEIEVPGCPPVVIEQPDVAAKWPDHVRVRQIIDAPVSMSKLGLWQEPKPRNELDVLRFIMLRAALAAPQKVGLITYKGLIEKIAERLPANVAARHFGALAGMNDMQDVVGLIVIGRPAPKRDAVEAAASVFAGRPVSGGEGHFFYRHPGGIQLADGSVVATTIDRHLEPIAEALRWRITVGELLQAVGRLRPHRRRESCWLDIVCEVPLPIPVHEVVRWGDVAPSAVGDMAARGVVLTNSRDAMSAFGLSDWEVRGVGGFSIESLIRHSTDSSPARKFTYQKAGAGQKRYTGFYLPSILPCGITALRGWLEERVGPLASLEAERIPSRATFARIGRETAGRLKSATAFSPALDASAAFLGDIEQNR